MPAEESEVCLSVPSRPLNFKFYVSEAIGGCNEQTVQEEVLTASFRCDLSRPCQTCRDRDHPELCSYHPPNKRQNGEQPAPPVPVPRSDDGFAAPGVAPSAAGTVTLSQAQFDMLCNKLNGLEESITELRSEIARNSESQAANSNHDPALYANRDNQKAINLGILANGQTSNGDGEAPRFQRHAATHGIHAKNELVCIFLG